MNHLQSGQFYGQTNRILHLNGIVLTDTVYTHEKVDWHYHENPYFTFLLQGNLIEANRQENYNCSPGSLLFHNWQEPHYNIKPPGFARGFHIELTNLWMNNTDFDLSSLQGSIQVKDPAIKLLLYNIFREIHINDTVTSLSVNELLLQAFAHMQTVHEKHYRNKPAWVTTVKEILHERYDENISLTELASTLAIHPGHLSRDFRKYFKCNMGTYIRKIKIEKALSLLCDSKNSLTAITFECGFADQSHFTRCFKEMMGMSPIKFRKIIKG